MKKSRLILVLALTATIVLIALTVFTGCGKVAQFSDPITENILISMNKADYAGFSKDFDETMKAELTEAAFPDFLAQINGVIGNYKEGSKKIVGVNIENELTTATYTANYENAEGVSVEVTFKKINDQMKVVGLWLK
jgi:major membrane immunogen (membrane-anchored lipoprotein)